MMYSKIAQLQENGQNFNIKKEQEMEKLVT